MSQDESTATLKFGGGEPWFVAKGDPTEIKRQIMVVYGLDFEHYETKTLAEVMVDADMIGESLRKAARKAAAQGYKPKTTISAPKVEPQTQEPEESVGPFGLAAFVKNAKTAEELYDLHDKNKEIWTDELTELAKERKRELGIS